MNFCGQQLGLGRVERQIESTTARAAFAGQLREDRAMPARYIFLLTFCEKFSSGRVREDPAASAPQRRRGHTGTGAAGALLAPRLLGRVLDLARGPSARGCPGGRWPGRPPRPGAPALRCSHGRTRCPARRPCDVAWPCSFRSSSSIIWLLSSALTLTAGVTTTWPLFAPGTAPLDQQQLAVCVDANDVEVLHGHGIVAEVAGHALAREHAARILRHRDRARHVVRTAVAVRRALRAEVVALDRAGEALADRRALHVDHLAHCEQVVTGTTAPA